MVSVKFFLFAVLLVVAVSVVTATLDGIQEQVRPDCPRVDGESPITKGTREFYDDDRVFALG